MCAEATLLLTTVYKQLPLIQVSIVYQHYKYAELSFTFTCDAL